MLSRIGVMRLLSFCKFMLWHAIFNPPGYVSSLGRDRQQHARGFRSLLLYAESIDIDELESHVAGDLKRADG